MALAAWHGGDERVATYERFTSALSVTQTEEIFDNFRRQEGGDVSNLAVNFYLKSATEDARGFEFTHKSFSEYLIARALIRKAIDVAEFSKKRLDIALSDWLSVVADGDLSDELLEFVRGEALLVEDAVTAKSVLRALERMMSQVVIDGFPAHKILCETWRQAEERQRKAETLLMALLHCFSRRVSVHDVTEGRIHIEWGPNHTGLGNLIHRIRRTRDAHLPTMLLFSNLEAPDSILIAQDLIQADFSGANLFRSHAANTFFTGANLEGVNFNEAVLFHSTFRHADLRSANMEASLCDSADFRSADLRNANFNYADLEDADLAGTNLEGATFRGANLKDARLGDAKSTDAVFKGADFLGTNVRPRMRRRVDRPNRRKKK